MKRILESNSSHSEIPIPSRTEDAGLPPQPQGNTPAVPDENSTIPHLSNRPPTPDPVDAWVDSLLTHALPDSLSDSGMTSAPRLVNAQQLHAGESESSMTPELPLQSNPHAANSNSSIAPAAASEVLTCLKEAAQHGDAIAQSNLGRMYAIGDGVAQDKSQAVHWYRLAANQGNANAQFNLGRMYEKGDGVAQNESQAVAWYLLAANQGNALAQFDLGARYINGIGVEQDMRQAVAWYRLAAHQGNADGQFMLGWMHKTGIGLEQDEIQAVAWYRLAANQGHAIAQLNLGWMYVTGKGVEQDKSQAVAWYRLAANQGLADAQHDLAWMYEIGAGVAQDLSQALDWYHLAANQGHADAQFKVVSFYFDGSDVIKDMELATYWELKYGLTDDDKRIILTNPYEEMLEFVPDVLNKFTEFQAVTKLVLVNDSTEEDGFAGIGKLIKANSTLESLRIKGVSDRKAMMALFVENLQFNTQLTKLSCDNECSDLEGSDDEDSDSSDRVDESVEAQKTKLLDRNKAIAELRQYLKMHPPVRSDELPFELLIPLADDLIINNLRSGKTREETKAALDEFLLSAQYGTMTATTPQSG